MRKSPPLQNWPRFYSFGLVCLATLFTAKCDRRIDLQNLYRATPANVPSFRQLAAYPFDRAGNIQTDYVLTEADQVEINWKEADRQGHLIKVATFMCSGDGCKTCPDSGIPANISLIEGLHPRVPLAVLGRVNGIEITDVDRSEVVASVILCGDSQQFILDQSKRPKWPDVIYAFKDHPRIDISLVPSPARYAFPGDLIRITTEWQFLTGDTADTYTLAQVQSSVDQYGRALVPGLSSPALKGQVIADLRNSGLKREWLSDLDRRAFEIRFWQPGHALSQQMSLQRISACLSAIWTNSDLTGNPIPSSLAQEIRDCYSLGIESSYYADSQSLGENNHRVRYQIEVDQSWNLVIDKEQVYQRTFSSGETITQGVSRALREIQGREFRPGEYKGGKIFVVVVPRRELGPVDSAPFWGELNSRHSNDLDSIYIAPGDSIILTKRKPKT